MTGSVICGGLSVPPKTSVRPALPSLKMMTPIAPAACALSAFWRNVHVPRWMRAIFPETEAGKSEASQPLVEPPGEGMMMSFLAAPALVRRESDRCLDSRTGGDRRTGMAHAA
jgi:hypothetical protein